MLAVHLRTRTTRLLPASCAHNLFTQQGGAKKKDESSDGPEKGHFDLIRMSIWIIQRSPREL